MSTGRIERRAGHATRLASQSKKQGRKGSFERGGLLVVVASLVEDRRVGCVAGETWRELCERVLARGKERGRREGGERGRREKASDQKKKKQAGAQWTIGKRKERRGRGSYAVGSLLQRGARGAYVRRQAC